MDKDNVDSTSADGIGVLNVNQTRTGTSTFTGAVLASTTLTVGANDTGYDVKFFGASSGAFMEWDESADELEIRGATAAGPGKLLLSTGELTNENGGILGRIDFQAPLDSAGTDAILVAASIWAEADDTFASGLNDADLVFAVSESETAVERMRLAWDGATTELNFAQVCNISSGGDITLTATGDVNLPANVGMTFGNDGEKIEGDGTDLTIAGNNINLTAVADIVVPADVGITFGSGEKIEGDDVNLTITSGVDIALNAAGDVNIPTDVGITFGDDGEKIEGDGTDLTITGNKINLTPTADVHIASGTGLVIGHTATLFNAAVESNSSGANLNTYLNAWSTSNTQRAVLNFVKSASATIGTGSETADTERLGDIVFNGYAQDDAQDQSVIVRCVQDGAAGASRTPGRFSVMTATTSASPVERLRVDTTGDTYTNDGTISSLSDTAAKQDISPFTDGLSIINKLNPINYKFNGVYPMAPADGISRIGFAADEVAKVAPFLTQQKKEAVYEGEEGEETIVRRDDVYTLNQIKMIPLLVNAVKELDARTR